MALLALPSSILLLTFAVFATTFASPLPPTVSIDYASSHRLSKRNASARKIGINICITLSVIICAALFFFLGMRRGTSGSWFCLPKTTTWPWTPNRRRNRNRRPWKWPWQTKRAPVFELDSQQVRRRSRRSWHREYTRAEESNTTPTSPMIATPLSPIARSRNQIREARQAETSRRETHSRTESAAHPAPLNPNMHEIASRASHRSPSPHQAPTATSRQSIPQAWFFYWRSHFSQPHPDCKALPQDRPPSLRRWYSVKSHVSRSNTMRSRRRQDVNHSRWSKSTTYSLYELDGASAPPPPPPPPAYPEQALVWGGLGEKESSRTEGKRENYGKRASMWRAT